MKIMRKGENTKMEKQKMKRVRGERLDSTG